MCQLNPCGPPMVALARTRGHFHFAQEGVHFRDGEHAPGPNRAVTGHRCLYQVEPFFEQQSRAVLRKVIGNIADQGLDVQILLGGPDIDPVRVVASDAEGNASAPLDLSVTVVPDVGGTGRTRGARAWGCRG